MKWHRTFYGMSEKVRRRKRETFNEFYAADEREEGVAIIFALITLYIV